MRDPDFNVGRLSELAKCKSLARLASQQMMLRHINGLPAESSKRDRPLSGFDTIRGFVRRFAAHPGPRIGSVGHWALGV
jgi:hypothetical protein